MICAIFVQPRVGSRQGKTGDYVHYAGIMFVRKATICTSGRLTDSCRELYGLCCFGHPLRCLAIRQTIKLSWLCCVQIGRFRFIRWVVRQAFCREEVCPSVIHFGAILHSCEKLKLISYKCWATVCMLHSLSLDTYTGQTNSLLVDWERSGSGKNPRRCQAYHLPAYKQLKHISAAVVRPSERDWGTLFAP